MNKLIEALQIFLKYKNLDYPTHCEHDIMMIMGIEKHEVSEIDQEKLQSLGFYWSIGHDCYCSCLFGGA